MPSIQPTDRREATQLASSIVIFPDGNGERFDVSAMRFGLGHPKSPALNVFTEKCKKMCEIYIQTTQLPQTFTHPKAHRY